MTTTSRPWMVAIACALTLMACSSNGLSDSTDVDVGDYLDDQHSTLKTEDSATTAPVTAATTTTVETAAGGEITVTTDIPYFERDGVEMHLDVYNPGFADHMPLVVLFHPNPVFGNTKEGEAELATEIASRGAVVVVPTYGSRASTADMLALASDVEVWFGEQGPCAVWAAADLAVGLGADPEAPVVVVGDVTGVGPAQMALFSPPSHVDGCLSSPTSVTIGRAILFETDWFWVPDLWDPVIAADAEFVERMSFWDDLDAPLSTAVRLLYGELGAFNTVRDLDGSYLETDWIRLRDPEGALAEAFARSGNLDDGSMSFTDVARIAVDALVAAGWDAELIVVPGVGHSLGSGEAIQLVADLVFDDG